MFGPTRGVFRDGRFNGTMRNIVGPTLVAMATKFGLGAKIQSPTGLSVCLCVCIVCVWSVGDRLCHGNEHEHVDDQWSSNR